MSPVTPTLLRSATLAIPPTMVRKTIGPISICIAVTKVVPIGSIATPAMVLSHPRRTPTMIASSPEVKLLVPTFLVVIGPVGLGGGFVVMHDVTSVR